MSRKIQNVPRNLILASPLKPDFAQKSEPGQGRKRPATRRRPPKSKKIASTRERVFQNELARIRGVDIPTLPKEKKLPPPQIFKPKPEKKRSLLDQVKEGLRGKGKSDPVT